MNVSKAVSATSLQPNSSPFQSLRQLVGISRKLVSVCFQFLVDRVERDVGQQWRQRATLRHSRSVVLADIVVPHNLARSLLSRARPLPTTPKPNA